MAAWQLPASLHYDRALEHLMWFRGLIELLEDHELELRWSQCLRIKQSTEAAVVCVIDCLSHSINDFLHNNEGAANEVFVSFILMEYRISEPLDPPRVSEFARNIRSGNDVLRAMPTVQDMELPVITAHFCVDPLVQFVHRCRRAQLERIHWLHMLDAVDNLSFKATRSFVRWLGNLYHATTRGVTKDLDSIAQMLPSFARLMFHVSDTQCRLAMERCRHGGSDCNSVTSC
jgi:hypothetical protein